MNRMPPMTPISRLNGPPPMADQAALPVTFLMLGFQRCGTTWVDEALREHPEIFLPASKQTFYFNRDYDEKPLSCYAAHFADVQSHHKAVGEIASHYTAPEVIPRIARELPHARIILAMRNPVERAGSNFFAKQGEGNSWGSFEEAIEQSPALLTRGQYADTVEVLLEHYDREQLLFLFYDDLLKDDRAYLRSILRFIGVDPTFESSQIGQRRYGSKTARLRKVLGPIGRSRVLHRFRRTPLFNLARKTINRFDRIDYNRTIAPAMRARLIEHFRPYNDRLAELTGRDLSAWNR